MPCFCQTHQHVMMTARSGGWYCARMAGLLPSPPAISVGQHVGLDHTDRMCGDQRTSKEVRGPRSTAQWSRRLEIQTQGDKGAAVSKDEARRGSAVGS